MSLYPDKKTLEDRVCDLESRLNEVYNLIGRFEGLIKSDEQGACQHVNARKTKNNKTWYCPDCRQFIKQKEPVK